MKYERVIIQGELHCLSELHMGSGVLGKRGKEAANYNEIVLDHIGRPYIPASSLRGYLCDHLTDYSYQQQLFGDTGQMGALRVYDARLSPEQESMEIHRSRIAVDAITRTAAENKLFNDILVPRGSRFQVRLELDSIEDQVLNALLDTLGSLNADNPLARLGQGKSHGRGQIAWKPSSVRVLSEEAFCDWLENENQPLKQAGWEEYEHQGSFVTAVETLRLHFRFYEPVLVNDPALVKPKKNKDDQEPDMRFMRINDDELLLPGSSIKGLFRARARRILLTMGASEKRADEMLGTLFGSAEKGLGNLLWYDALASGVQAHEQSLIAIDRFTGGVQDGAMLQLEAARVNVAESALALRNPLRGWQRALFLLLLRDAMEGDLALGWGQARGFGGFHLEITQGETRYGEFAAYRDVRTKEEWERDFAALQNEIEKETGNQDSGEEGA